MPGMKLPASLPYKNCLKSWFNFKVMLWYTWYSVKNAVVQEVNAWKVALKRSNYD